MDALNTVYDSICIVPITIKVITLTETVFTAHLQFAVRLLITGTGRIKKLSP